jgi:hypothetical protein
MSTPSTTYRVYCFDSARHIVSVDEIEAANDEQAIDKAHAQGFGDRCEIWDGKRMVAMLDAKRQQA